VIEFIIKSTFLQNNLFWLQELWCFEPPTSKFGIVHQAQRCAKGTQGFILVQAKCPASSLMLLILLGTNLQ
jgi:hypothetical protein